MFPFYAFVITAQSAATMAIDLGSYFTKSSLFNLTSTPKIAENTDSKRVTPSFVAFRIRKGMDTQKKTLLEPSEVENALPAIGNKALYLMERRPFMGAGFFTYYCDLEPSRAKSFAERVVANSSITRFSYEDSLALYFQLYSQSIIPGREPRSAGVIVPATFTIRQRHIIENAIRNAKVRFTRIIDDNEAVFTYYAVERIRLFKNRPQTVLFVDVGAASVKAYAATFALVQEKGKPTAHVNVTKHSYSISNEEGGALVTSRIMDHIIEKNGLKNLNEGERHRIYTACEAMKKALALPNIHRTSQYIEDIGDESEMTLTLTEEELEPLTKPLLEEVVRVASDAAKNLTIDNIQLIGGSSRLKSVAVAVQEKLNITVHSNINQEETIAIGGGYALQYKLKQSRLSAIEWNDTFPVLSMSAEAAGITQRVCTRGQKCNSKMTFVNPKRRLNLIYNETELPLPLMNTVLSYNISKSDLPLSIHFDSAPARILYSSFCNGTNCTTAYLVPTLFDHVSSPAYSTILKMEATRKAVATARTNLESFTQRILDHLEENNDFTEFMSDSEKFVLKKQANKMSKWLNDNANSVTNESVFKNCYNELNAYLIPVTKRIQENVTFAKEERIFYDSMQSAMMTMYGWMVNKTWLNETTINGYNKLINESMTLFDKIVQAKKTTPLYEKFPVSVESLKNLSKLLYKEMLRIEAIPKPVIKHETFMDKFMKSSFVSKIKNSSFVNKLSGMFNRKPSNSTTVSNTTEKAKPTTKKGAEKSEAKKSSEKSETKPEPEQKQSTPSKENAKQPTKQENAEL